MWQSETFVALTYVYHPVEARVLSRQCCVAICSVLFDPRS